MIKTHWKQLLVTTYVILVLVLSATARAKTEVPTPNTGDNFFDLEQRISALFKGQSEPAVFSTSAIKFNISEPQIKSFQDTGYFMIDNSNSRLVFISANSGKIYYVKCGTDLRSKIHSGKFYVVSGYNISFKKEDSSNPRPPNLNSKELNFLDFTNQIYVTGVEIQR